MVEIKLTSEQVSTPKKTKKKESKLGAILWALLYFGLIVGLCLSGTWAFVKYYYYPIYVSSSEEEERKIAELFPAQDYEFKLDPSFEPEIKGRDDGMLPPDQKNTAIFAILQKFNRLNLVVPVGAPHMWHAAMENKSCKLTTLGEHYRRLAKNNRL